jgi:hypothetical protein
MVYAESESRTLFENASIHVCLVLSVVYAVAIAAAVIGSARKPTTSRF